VGILVVGMGRFLISCVDSRFCAGDENKGKKSGRCTEAAMRSIGDYAGRFGFAAAHDERNSARRVTAAQDV